MTIKEVINLTRGDKLICVPSGLIVTAWDIHKEGVEVRAPRGGCFTISLENLEVIPNG